MKKLCPKCNNLVELIEGNFSYSHQTGECKINKNEKFQKEQKLLEDFSGSEC